MRKRELTPEQVASNERVRRAHEEASYALQHNRCPTCGKTVRRNLSLTGWVQCSQFGAPAFRQDATLPPCEWQGFTV